MVCASLNLTWPVRLMQIWGSKVRVATEERGVCTPGRNEDLGLFQDEDWTHLRGVWASAASALTSARWHGKHQHTSRKMEAFHRQTISKEVSYVLEHKYRRCHAQIEFTSFTPKKKRRPAGIERSQLALPPTGEGVTG